MEGDGCKITYQRPKGEITVRPTVDSVIKDPWMAPEEKASKNTQLQGRTSIRERPKKAEEGKVLKDKAGSARQKSEKIGCDGALDSQHQQEAHGAGNQCHLVRWRRRRNK